MDNDKISRQALLDEINEEIEYGEEHFRPENEQINKGLKIARKLVKAAPSVDNGWISVEESGADWVQRGEEYYCSHCGGTAPMDINRKHTVTTKFCPHCGYKMGG